MFIAHKYSGGVFMKSAIIFFVSVFVVFLFCLLVSFYIWKDIY
jgi:hypothetical protein